MDLEEDLKAIRYIRERIDLRVTDEGFVIIPAWQFALFVREFDAYRNSTFAWLAMFVLVAFVFVIFVPMLG